MLVLKYRRHQQCPEQGAAGHGGARWVTEELTCVTLYLDLQGHEGLCFRVTAFGPCDGPTKASGQPSVTRVRK